MFWVFGGKVMLFWEFCVIATYRRLLHQHFGLQGDPSPPNPRPHPPVNIWAKTYLKPLNFLGKAHPVNIWSKTYLIHLNFSGEASPPNPRPDPPVNIWAKTPFQLLSWSPPSKLALTSDPKRTSTVSTLEVKLILSITSPKYTTFKALENVFRCWETKSNLFSFLKGIVS